MTSPAAGPVASPTLHATALFSMGVFLACVVAACLLRVEITARGVGRVVPLARVQTVQAEFPAAVAAIHVRDGMQVDKGDVLIELDATDAQVERGMIAEEEERLTIERDRLEDLLAGLAATDLREGRVPGPENPMFAPDEAGREGASFLHAQARLLAAEREDIGAGLRQATARIAANERAVEVTRETIARNDAALRIQSERLAAAARLAESGTASRGAYLQVLETHTGLRKGRDVLARELEQKIAATAVLEAERAAIVTARKNRALQRRNEIDASLAGLDQRRRAVDRRIKAATLTAPVAGTVEQLAVFTVGGVASAGQTLMHIVPSGGALEVQAVFPNRDSGFLAVSQRARIRLDAYPAERFGAVPARVSDIAADAIETGPGDWGFVVRLTPDTDFLATPAGRLPLRPGMTASVDAITGDRTLISYFIAPLISQLGSSLGER